MTKREILKYIESRDPDGGSRQPTVTERQEFHNWIIDLYGQAILDTYLASGWDDDCE